MLIALKREGLASNQLTLNPEFKQFALGERVVDCINVNSRILLSVSATGQNSSVCDLAYLRSYMIKSSFKYGVMIDIGNSEVQVRGVI